MWGHFFRLSDSQKHIFHRDIMIHSTLMSGLYGRAISGRSYKHVLFLSNALSKEESSLSANKISTVSSLSTNPRVNAIKTAHCSRFAFTHGPLSRGCIKRIRSVMDSFEIISTDSFQWMVAGIVWWKIRREFEVMVITPEKSTNLNETSDMDVLQWLGLYTLLSRFSLSLWSGEHFRMEKRLRTPQVEQMS